MSITLITEEEKEVVRMVGVIRKDDIVNYALNIQRNPKRYKKVYKYAQDAVNKAYDSLAGSEDLEWLKGIDTKTQGILVDQAMSKELIKFVSILTVRAVYALAAFGLRHGCTNTLILAGDDSVIIRELPNIEHAMLRMLNTKSGWVIPKEA